MLLIGRRRVVPALLSAGLIVALALLAAGCGGSSEAAPLKLPQFVKQGNEICVSAQKERTEQKDELSESEDSEEEVMQTLLEPIVGMVDDLSDLGPPEGQEKKVEAVIAAFEAGIAKLEAEPAGPDTVSAFDKANKLAENYGLTECTI